MKPVKTLDGRVTVPEEVLHSMERNKIGLKGTYIPHSKVNHMLDAVILFRSVGDADW